MPFAPLESSHSGRIAFTGLPMRASPFASFWLLWRFVMFVPRPVASAATRQEDTPPYGFHNLIVIVVMGALIVWTGKIMYQLFCTIDLNGRLANHQSLQLEGMSIYANDFHVLIRQHFNQILRIRRTVPPKRIMRHTLSSHVQPDSISVWFGEGSSGQENRAFGVQFTVDSLVPCCVKLFWGVSVAACNEFVQQRHQSSQCDIVGRWGSGSSGNGGGVIEFANRRDVVGRWGNGSANGGSGPSNTGAADAYSTRGRPWSRGTNTTQESQRSLLEMEDLGGLNLVGHDGTLDNNGLFMPGHYVVQSRDFFLPAGTGQRYATPAGDLVDPSQLEPWLYESDTGEEMEKLPLAIVVMAQRPPSHDLDMVQGSVVVRSQGQLSFVRFRRAYGREGDLGVPDIVRQLSFGDNAVHDIQGIYGFEEEGESDCMICYNRPKNIVLLPCRHCSVCHPCLRSLRDEKCPLCRSVFTSYVTFPIIRALPASEITPTPDRDPTSPSGSASHSVQSISGISGPDVGANNAGVTGDISPRAGASISPLREAPRPVNPVAHHSSSGSSGVAPSDMRHTAPAARPRGIPPMPRGTSQGLRLSGRTRLSDRVETAETPLLQDCGSPSHPNGRSESSVGERSRHEQTNLLEGATEEPSTPNLDIV